jgi:hypothetical protein
MTDKDEAGQRNFTIFAAALMVVLIAFGILHTMGVFR